MTDATRTEELERAERQLQAAMLAGDVAELDRLIDDRLIATLTPGVARVTKEQDLDNHRSGRLVLSRLVEEDLALVVDGRTGVTWVLTTLEGMDAGTPFAGRVLYTRTWVHDDDLGWRVLAAHITPV